MTPGQSDCDTTRCESDTTHEVLKDSSESSETLIGSLLDALPQLPIIWQMYLNRLRRSPRYQPLVLVAVAMMLGIAVDRNFNLCRAEMWFGLACVSLMLWVTIRKFADRFRITEWFASCLVLLSAAALAATWHHIEWRLFQSNEVGLYAQDLDRPIVLEATVTRAARMALPKPYDPLAGGFSKSSDVPTTRFKISVHAVRNGLSWQSASGNLSCYAYGDYHELQPGDQVRITGFFKSIQPALNPGEFDFAAHARADRELASLNTDIPNGIQVLKKAAWYWPGTWLPRLRAKGSELLHRYIPHGDATDDREETDQADLASAVLLGTREVLPQKQTEEFMLTGTVHILSISGLHVGILAWGLFHAMRLGLIGRGKALIAVVLITSMYVVMTDCEPPAMRALVLVWVLCLSMWIGRKGLAWNSLAASAIVVMAMNPCDLFRTGTQLSFLCMGVLTWVSSMLVNVPTSDPLDRLLERSVTVSHRVLINMIRWLGLGLFTSCTIWLVTLPLVMSRYYVVSPAALILNLILSPLISIAMVSGFIVLATGWWAPWIASVAGLVCNMTFGIMKSVIHFAAMSPGSHYFTSGPSDLWMIGLYIGLGCYCAFRYRLPSWKIGPCLLLLYIGLGWAESLWARHAEPELRCTMIAVGHGGAALIESPDGRVILYDCGRLGSPILGERAVEAVLRSRGIRRIDAIIISHADTDHYNAAPELLRRFDVSQIMTSTCMFDNVDKSPALQILYNSMKEHNVEHTLLRTGQELFPHDPSIRMRILHPPWGGSSKDNDNANSVVLEIEHRGKRLLLTGDLEKEGLTTLLKNEPKHYDVLLAPHHGSMTNNPYAMSRWATPDWVVMSSGLRDKVEKTEEIYKSEGAESLNLAKVGAVRILWTTGGLEVRSWRRDPW